MKHLASIALLAAIAGFGLTPAAEATPIQAQFRVTSRDAAPSTCIIPTLDLRPSVRARIVALMQASVADWMAAEAVPVGAPGSVAWRSPFPSPVSLRTGKTALSEALRSVRDPRELKPR